MKKILLTLFVILVASCSPEEQTINLSTTLSRPIGIQTKTPDIKIPEDDGGYVRYGVRPDGTYGQIERRIGVRLPHYKASEHPLLTQDSYPVYRVNDTLVLTYPCHIANIAEFDITGQNDLVIDRVADGIPEVETGDYLMEGMLSITTFRNGLPYAKVEKQSFWVASNVYAMGFDDLLGINYGLINENYMWIWAQTADLYYNKAKVPLGKSLIVIEFNPDKFINESNYNNNIATLPVNVIPQTIYQWNAIGHLDLSAIEENKTIPPSNIIVTRRVERGKKIVKLDWSCPYHEPNYVKHWFTVKRDGVIKYDGKDLSEFEDKTIQGNPHTLVYTITTTVKGLGESVPITVTVTR